MSIGNGFPNSHRLHQHQPWLFEVSSSDDDQLAKCQHSYWYSFNTSFSNTSGGRTYFYLLLFQFIPEYFTVSCISIMLWAYYSSLLFSFFSEVKFLDVALLSKLQYFPFFCPACFLCFFIWNFVLVFHLNAFFDSLICMHTQNILHVFSKIQCRIRQILCNVVGLPELGLQATSCPFAAVELVRGIQRSPGSPTSNLLKLQLSIAYFLVIQSTYFSFP